MLVGSEWEAGPLKSVPRSVLTTGRFEPKSGCVGPEKPESHEKGGIFGS